MSWKKIICMTTFFYSALLLASQKEVVQRKTLVPKDAAKLKSVEAKRWLNFGLKQKASDTTRTGGLGGTSCVTNIGTQNANSKIPHPLGQTKNNNTTVIVTGDIMNICK